MSIYNNKLSAGNTFPKLSVTRLDGVTVELGTPEDLEGDLPAWRMVVLYRGQHCPMCTEYLEQLKAYIDDLAAISIDVIAVSADSLEQLQAHLSRTDKL